MSVCPDTLDPTSLFRSVFFFRSSKQSKVVAPRIIRSGINRALPSVLLSGGETSEEVYFYVKRFDPTQSRSVRLEEREGGGGGKPDKQITGQGSFMDSSHRPFAANAGIKPGNAWKNVVCEIKMVGLRRFDSQPSVARIARLR